MSPLANPNAELCLSCFALRTYSLYTHTFTFTPTSLLLGPLHSHPSLEGVVVPQTCIHMLCARLSRRIVGNFRATPLEPHRKHSARILVTNRFGRPPIPAPAPQLYGEGIVRVSKNSQLAHGMPCVSGQRGKVPVGGASSVFDEESTYFLSCLA